MPWDRRFILNTSIYVKFEYNFGTCKSYSPNVVHIGVVLYADTTLPCLTIISIILFCSVTCPVGSLRFKTMGGVTLLFRFYFHTCVNKPESNRGECDREKSHFAECACALASFKG